jgi:SAM-dependent methyltransferase
MDAARFDTRGYETLPARKGYGLWAPTYDDAVPDQLDLRLLERVTSVDWAVAGAAVDLACGTGRTGAWLRSRGVSTIDGVDLTPQMLDQARDTGAYRNLTEADVGRTGLETGAYGLAVMCLADEHLEDLAPVYAEAARLTNDAGCFAVVGYHPHFLMLGVQTHFHPEGREPAAIRSYVHLFSDHFDAARAAGWTQAESHEGVVDEAWLASKPKWERYLHHPVSFAFVWRKGGGGAGDRRDSPRA